MWLRPWAAWQHEDADDWTLKAAPLCLSQLSAAATLVELLIPVRSSSSTKNKSVAVSSLFLFALVFPPVMCWLVVLNLSDTWTGKRSSSIVSGSVNEPSLHMSRMCRCLRWMESQTRLIVPPQGMNEAVWLSNDRRNRLTGDTLINVQTAFGTNCPPLLRHGFFRGGGVSVKLVGSTSHHYFPSGWIFQHLFIHMRISCTSSARPAPSLGAHGYRSCRSRRPSAPDNLFFIPPECLKRKTWRWGGGQVGGLLLSEVIKRRFCFRPSSYFSTLSNL